MRNRLYKLTVLFIISSLLIYSCSKSDGPHTITEISLTNKSADSLRYYLQGNWRIVKTFGGVASLTTLYPSNYLSFYPNDSLYWVDKGVVLCKSKFTFKKDKTIFGDTTHIINYLEQTTLSAFEIIAIKKRNDTLLLRDNHTEWFTYYLIPR
jgi:hypothetical protein